MEKWAHAKNLVLFPNFLAKIETISENHELDNGVRKKWRTAEPLGPACARRAPPGRPGAPPGATRERPGGARADRIAMDNWRHAKKLGTNKKNTTFFRNAKSKKIYGLQA